MGYNRIDKESYYLSIAKTVSERSTCLRRRYGAVIVKNDEVIATGYNGAPRGEENCIDIGTCTREELGVAKGERYELCLAVHAEQNAIISAPRSEMQDATIYIYGVDSSGHEADPTPCKLCRRMIKNAGIIKCVGMVDGKPKEISLSGNTNIKLVQIEANKQKELSDVIPYDNLLIYDGDPVWVESLSSKIPYSTYAIIWVSMRHASNGHMCFKFKDYGKSWVAYRKGPNN